MLAQVRPQPLVTLSGPEPCDMRGTLSNAPHMGRRHQTSRCSSFTSETRLRPYAAMDRLASASGLR
jgi:hypothetical protein